MRCEMIKHYKAQNQKHFYLVIEFVLIIKNWAALSNLCQIFLELVLFQNALWKNFNKLYTKMMSLLMLR